MESQNKTMISNLTLELEREKRLRAEDARKMEELRKKAEDDWSRFWCDSNLQVITILN